MKKTIVFWLVLVLVLASCSFAFASTEDAVEPSVAPRIGEQNKLSVPLYQQKENNYCGIACLQMAIKFINGEKVPQSVLSQDIIEPTGTRPGNITKRINQYVGSGVYRYIGMWEAAEKGSFYNNLKKSINAKRPVFCQVKTKVLPNYRETGLDLGHWILATGYVIQAGATTQIGIYYNDPIDRPQYYGSYSAYLEDMEDAINNHSGWYVSD